jgi:DNA topoisomerase-1
MLSNVSVGADLKLDFGLTLDGNFTPILYDTTGLDISVGEKNTLFRATGQTLVFPGFIAVYQEGADDSAEEGEEKLPNLEEGA